MTMTARAGGRKIKRRVATTYACLHTTLSLVEPQYSDESSESLMHVGGATGLGVIYGRRRLLLRSILWIQQMSFPHRTKT